jgi:hypothetical protein
MRADQDTPEHGRDDGILVDGSPFREILLRATTLKRASERVLAGASPVDGRDGVVVPAETIEELRQALTFWATPIDK